MPSFNNFFGRRGNVMSTSGGRLVRFTGRGEAAANGEILDGELNIHVTLS